MGCFTSGSAAKSVALKPGGSVMAFTASAPESAAGCASDFDSAADNDMTSPRTSGRSSLSFMVAFMDVWDGSLLRLIFPASLFSFGNFQPVALRDEELFHLLDGRRIFQKVGEAFVAPLWSAAAQTLPTEVALTVGSGDAKGFGVIAHGETVVAQEQEQIEPVA